MFDLAKGLCRLQLTDEEMALFSAAVLLSPERPWLTDSQKVRKLQEKLFLALQHSLHMSGAADEKLDQVRPSTLHGTITTKHTPQSLAMAQLSLAEIHHIGVTGVAYVSSPRTL